jgi:hypothetical protein
MPAPTITATLEPPDLTVGQPSTLTVQVDDDDEVPQARRARITVLARDESGNVVDTVIETTVIGTRPEEVTVTVTCDDPAVTVEQVDPGVWTVVAVR